MNGIDTATASEEVRDMRANRWNVEHVRAMIRIRSTVIGLAVATVALTGCKGIFDAENPGAITEDKLNNAAIIDPMLSGAITEFNDAFDLSVNLTGLLSDELVASGSWPSWHDADERGILALDAPVGAGNITEPMWNDWQQARFMAEETYRRIQELLDNPGSDPRAAAAQLYAGMSYYAFGDFFCRAAYEGGPAVQPAESYGLAEERLTSAIQIAQAAGVDSTAEMAYLARARTRLMLGDGAGALSDARMVPDGFRWWADFENTSGLTTDTWGELNQRGESTVGPPFQGLDDPRVPVVWDNGNTGPDRKTELWIQEKYPERFSDMPVGKWEEARLIEAEVLIGQGSVPEAMGLVNKTRAAVDLEPLPTDLTQAEATDVLRRERSRETFLETRRYADMRRYGLFPQGWGASCIPISRSELDSNPNLQGG